MARLKASLRSVVLGSLLFGVSMSALMPSKAVTQEPSFWTVLEKGTHDVGFRRVWTLDRSRVWLRSPALDSATGTIARVSSGIRANFVEPPLTIAIGKP